MFLEKRIVGIEIPKTVTSESFGSVLEDLKGKASNEELFSSRRGDTFLVGAGRHDLLTAMKFMEVALSDHVRQRQEADPDRVYEPELLYMSEPTYHGIRTVIESYPLSDDVTVTVEKDVLVPRSGVELPRVDRLEVKAHHTIDPVQVA